MKHLRQFLVRRIQLLRRNKVSSIHLRRGLTLHPPPSRRNQSVFGRNTLGELLPLDQRRVLRRPFARSISNLAVARNQPPPVDLPMACRQTNQQLASRRSRFPQLRTHGRRSPAPERSHVVRSKLRISHHHFY